jgi:hypothetical protein
MKIEVGQIVKGIKVGTFVVLRFRIVGNERYAQLKEVCPLTGRKGRGEICLPVSALKA